jgi:folate-binding protein YgfZ
MRDLHLRGYHEASGAVFRTEGGYRVPASYRTLGEEVFAVRHTAGVMDASDRVKVRVRGPDRTSFLDGLLTADIKVLPPDGCAYALLLTDKSRVVGDLRIYTSEDAYVLDFEGSRASSLLAYIQKFLISDDVVLEHLGPSAHLEVHGPAAARALTSALGIDVRGVPVDRTLTFSATKRLSGHVARVDGLGETGFAVWATGTDLGALWARLAVSEVVPVGRDAFDVLRIEAGVPRLGADMGEDTLALEVAPPGAISLTKGCYVGQEVVARGTYVGHMNRRLMGLQVDGDVVPERGDRVRAHDADIGHVTSGAWSPTLNRVLALALLRIGAATPAMDLSIDRGGWDLRASVHPLPFVKGRA